MRDKRPGPNDLSLPAYSVVIPTFERPRLLARALRSVCAQSHPPAQIIVVIDEEPSGSKYAFLDEFDPRPQYFFTGGGARCPAARNAALDKVDTGYVFFLDDDDEWYSHKIEAQLRALENAPDAIGVSCWHLMKKERGATQQNRFTESKVRACLPTRNIMGSPSFFGYRFDKRTRHLRNDPRLNAVEDMDFYLQLSRHGKFVVVPEVLGIYHQHSGPRLTFDLMSKITSTRIIMTKHPDLIRGRARMWGEGKWRLLASRTETTPAMKWKSFLLGSILVFASGKHIRRSMKIVGRTWEELVSTPIDRGSCSNPRIQPPNLGA